MEEVKTEGDGTEEDGNSAGEEGSKEGGIQDR